MNKTQISCGALKNGVELSDKLTDDAEAHLGFDAIELHTFV
jgi:hypothetical protein